MAVDIGYIHAGGKSVKAHCNLVAGVCGARQETSAKRIHIGFQLTVPSDKECIGIAACGCDDKATCGIIGRYSRKSMMILCGVLPP